MDLDDAPVSPPTSANRDARQWAMFLHFSTLAGYAVPLAGLVAPIIIWQTKKEEFPAIDAHGKAVMNFIISYLLWGLVSLPLCLVIIGIPMLWALGIAAVVLPIIAGVKANDGGLWKYPLTIEFFK